jgi:mannose-6-phosphate isomerase
MARNPGREHITDEGLSKIYLENGVSIPLKQMIEEEPITLLGAKHVEKYGCNMSMLAKVIDSLNRLTIQVHPDKEFAKNVFASDYGKTEAWYILGGREVEGQEPYVLLGFKPGMTKERWKRLFDDQNIEEMVNSLHKIMVKPGEVYLIEGGVPHAIGSGCFLIEIQEPTDYTIRVERKTPEGREIPDQLCHQGAGFGKMFDCFHFDSYSMDETMARWRIATKLLYRDEKAEEWILIGEASTKLFGMHKIVVRGRYEKKLSGSYSVLVVVKGSGHICSSEGITDIRKGEMLFVPASVENITIESCDKNGIELVMCLPPQ